MPADIFLASLPTFPGEGSSKEASIELYIGSASEHEPSSESDVSHRASAAGPRARVSLRLRHHGCDRPSEWNGLSHSSTLGPRGAAEVHVGEAGHRGALAAAAAPVLRDHG